MKHNGKNIITDQDVTLTGNDFAGKTLDTVLTEQDERLDRIESNVKWIYKYGGVGSGSGGGSGSGSSTRWSVKIWRVDTNQPIESGTLNLSGPGSYSFKVVVYRGGSDTFTVKYSYQSSKGNVVASDILNTNNSFTAVRSLALDVNGTLTIEISNRSEPDEPPISYIIPYIVSSYSFNLYYVYADNHEVFTNHSNNTIFMNDIKGRGIMAALDYSVAVNLQAASFTYTDWEGNTVTNDNEISGKSSKIIYIPLCSDINAYLSDNNNAKFKQFILDVDIVLEGQTVKENIPQLSLKDTLIPSDLFLRVTASGGTLYDSWQETVDPSNQFIVGTIVFQVTPFYGAMTIGRTYNFSVFLNDVKLGEEEGIRVTTLSDQQMQSLPIPAPGAGEYKITFSIIEPATQTSYTIDYWFITKEATSSFSYYPKRSNASGSYTIPTEASDVYRKLSFANNIEGVTPTTSFNITSASDEAVQYNFQSPDKTNYETLDQMLCLGIQYVRTNDIERPIARFNVSGGPIGDIYIYQDKIVINEDSRVSDVNNISGSSCEIYLPMCHKLSDNLSDYHLLTIYKRLEKVEGNNHWKGIYVFIDGDLEGVFGTFTTTHKKYSSITFFPGNYYINLIENTCFSHTAEDQYHHYMDDIDIKGYYYAYKELILGERVSEETKQLYDNFSTFRADEDNFIMTNESAIHNIAEYSEIPTIIFNFTDNNPEVGASGKKQSELGYIDVFKVFMSESYKENTKFTPVPITVSYSPGKSKPEVIQKDGSPAVFSVEPQGSSTREYRCKNWELFAPSASDENHVCIYSPNFKESDTTTFLPEESFTLKADVVDSSHTNNNAIANFVNDVTTAFSGAKLGQRNPTTNRPSKYVNYIKNCLSGFPVLVFLHTNFKDNADQRELNVHNYYFLGIYNFNLGRNSYFNLGYKNTAFLESVDLQEGFGIYEIPRSSNNLLTGIMVGEVQGNNNYFDFSQYHQSILFPLPNLEGSDTTYMWGDLVPDSAPTRTAIGQFVAKVARAGGFIFDEIGKKYSDDVDHGYKEGYSVIDQVPDYTWRAERTQTGTTPVYTYSPDSRATINDLADFLITPEDNDEKHKGIDYDSLCEYYTTCMAFGLVDSVQKNLNIKSWNSGQEFYLAFYDMDTCLGVSNSGSKISYFAFSDYWDWQNSIDNGVLGPVKVYRDYAPHGEDNISSDSFFDTPSSYLFAIAKYAYIVLKKAMSGSSVDTLVMHPNNIWAKWRKQGGPLANSETFINKYYKHHLAGVPEVAFNYNYRYKYFVKSENGQGFDDINFPKFYGRKIAYTETWLDNRLHILDAYFNINKIAEELNGYSAPMVTVDDYVDQSNPDIYVFHDIFSNSSVGKQYANASAIVNVKAKAYSPLICVTPTGSSRYMFSDQENTGYDFLFKTNGNQTCLFGGSAMWTEVDSINPFIIYGTTSSTSGFSIKSDYFTKITGSAGTCSSWSFDTPSLKSLSLTNRTDVATYSGKIVFDGLENYPNLRDVRIDGTAIDLTITNSNVVSISALNMKPGAKLTVSNTPNLSSISISGSLGTLSLPCWGENIRIPGDGGSIDSDTINIQNIKYPGASIEVSNAPNLVSLVLTGFSKIVVYNCPKLRSIVLGNVEDLENFGLRTLDITVPQVGPSSTVTVSSTLTIGPAETETNTVDLSAWNLEALRLRNTPIEKVLVKDGCDINLFPGAFNECRKLRTISGNSTFWIHSSEDFELHQAGGDGPETFYNAIRFKGTQEDDSLVDIRVHANCTNLGKAFFIDYGKLGGHGELGLDVVSRFLSEGSEDAGNVACIDNLFEGQSVRYTVDMMRNEYNQGKCSLSLSHYTGCYRFQGVFRVTHVSAYNRYMFEGLGSNAPAGINSLEGQGFAFSQVATVIDNPPIQSKYVNGNTISERVIYATTDFLQEIIDRTYSITIGSQSDQNSRLCFIDPATGDVLDTVRVHDIFCPDGVVPAKLMKLSYIEFFPGHTFDMSGAFEWGTSLPLIISYFMYSIEYRYFVDGSLEGLFHFTSPSRRLTRATYSFNNLSNYPSEVDLAGFIDWEKIDSNCTLFYEQTGVFSLGFKKKVSYSDFKDVVWYNILKHPPRNMGGFFTDCSVYFSSQAEASQDFELISSSHEGETLQGSQDITDISFLFMALRAKIEGGTGDYVPIRFTSRFLKWLPNVTTAKAAFKNTYWANPVPWNFFRKRVKTEAQSCYVWNGEEFISGTVRKYDYKKEISDMAECFSGISLQRCQAWKYNDSYNDVLEPWEIEGSDGNTYDKCYESPSFDSEIHDWAWEDAHEELDCAIPYEDWKPGGDGSTVTWTNPIITKAYGNGLFCSPDVFYSCSAGASVVSCFSATGFPNRQTPVFTGAIPRHLVWPLGKSSDLSNMMSNLNILPRFYGEYTTEVDGYEKINRCYYYIPSGYTTRTSLSNAFNFKMILPQESTTSGGKIYKDYYYLLLSDSLPKDVVALNNSFPSTSIVVGQNWSMKINYIEGDRVISDGIYYALCGEPIEEGGEFVGMDTGLDLEYYDSLRLDGLIQPSLAAIISGKIFKTTEQVAMWSPGMYLNNVSNCVIYLGSSGLSYAAKIYMPRLNRQYMSATSPCYILSDSIINDQEQVPSEEVSNGLLYYPNILITNI